MMRILLLALLLYSKFVTATSRATCFLSPTARGISANGGYFPQGRVIIDSKIDERRRCSNYEKKCLVTTFSFDHFDVPSIFSSKKFGVHVHQFGDISDQDLASNMGQHYAKTQTERHGCPGNSSIHDGDLGNVEFSEQAVPKKNITIPPNDTAGKQQLLDLKDIIGRGIVFHGSEDQCNTAPPDRWAQCVIGILDDSDTVANVPDAAIGACSFQPTQLSEDYMTEWDTSNTAPTGTLYFRKVDSSVQIWGTISGLIDITSFTVRLDMLGDISVRNSTCAGTGDWDIYLGGGDVDTPLLVDADIDSYTFGGWLAENEAMSSFVGYAVTLRQVERNPTTGQLEEVGCLAQCVIGTVNSSSVSPPPETTTGAGTTGAGTTGAGTTGVGTTGAGTSGAATSDVGTTGAGTTGASAATSADSGGAASGGASSSSSASASSSSSSSSGGGDESTSSTTRSSTVPPTVTEDSAPGTAVIAVFLVICVVFIAVWKRDFIISTLRGFVNRRSFGGSGGTPVRLPTDEEAADVPMMPVSQERSSRAPERQERAVSFSRPAPAPAPRSLSPTRSDRPAAQRIAATDWNEDDWKDGWDDDDMSPPTRK